MGNVEEGRMTVFAGADAGKVGSRSGWVVVLVTVSIVVSVEFHSDLEVVIDRAELLAVDIPIGLPGDEGVVGAISGVGRRADEVCRRLLGPRASSVFPAPPFAALAASSYQQARAISPSLTAQSFSLGTRIVEIRELASRLGQSVVEFHPELTFRMLAGAPLQHSKRSWNGQQERRQLLAQIGVRIADVLPAAVGGACPDDVLDAAAGAVTAAAIASGRCRALGWDGNQQPTRDTRGLIWTPSERTPNGERAVERDVRGRGGGEDGGRVRRV
jgi:predicted RNase H-like nuclease